MSITYLISTPAPFRHSFSSEVVSIIQLPCNLGDYGVLAHRGPLEKHFFGLKVGTSATDRPGIRSIDIDPEQVIGLLALFYGKGIQNHGPILMEGVPTLPTLLGTPPNPYFDHATYSGDHTKSPTRDNDWRQVTALGGLFQQLTPAGGKPPAIVAAAKCYSEALNLLPLDRELAYFRLVQALECASAGSQFTEVERFAYDEQLWGYLEWLQSLEDPKGKRCAKFIKGRLYQVSRSVQLWLKTHIDAPFHVDEPLAIGLGDLPSAISAAYALRSLYVHRGVVFGAYIDPSPGRCAASERIPEWLLEVCDDKELQKVLTKAPSFFGLERVVRFSLSKEIESRRLVSD